MLQINFHNVEKLNDSCLAETCPGSCLIADVVDLESEEGDSFIKPEICPDLDKLKDTYNQLPGLLTQVFFEHSLD